MHIENGLLKGSRFVKATSSGGAMTPRWIVLHDTAGALRKFSSVEWFSSKACTTSAHFVVERDGTITQMVPTTRRAYHAGASTYRGVSGLNSCSVGIEIVNPGKLDATGKAYFGKAAEPTEIVPASSTEHGAGYWLPYTKEQIAAVIAICRAVVEEYPDCNEIVAHYHISPGRKIDVGPHFPLEEVRRAVFHPAPDALEDAPPQPPQPAEPTFAAEAARSRSVWMLLSVIFAKLADAFFGALDWVSARFTDVVAVLKATEAEAGAMIAPLVSLAQKLHVNLGRVTIGLTVGVLAIVVARHVRDKVALAKAKANSINEVTS